MISLLPPTQKKELLAARANTLLLRYIVALAVLMAIICIEIGFVYVVLKNEQSVSQAAIEDNQRKTAEFADVKQQATAFSNDLKVAESIMAKQVPYAAILREFSNTMPAGTVIDRIAIDPDTIGQPVTLNVRGKGHTAILAFKDAFNQSEYFEDAKIMNITESSGGEGANASYPTAGTIEVTFKKELLQLETQP